VDPHQAEGSELGQSGLDAGFLEAGFQGHAGDAGPCQPAAFAGVGGEGDQYGLGYRLDVFQVGGDAKVGE
jgi:hypothetical protein